MLHAGDTLAGYLELQQVQACSTQGISGESSGAEAGTDVSQNVLCLCCIGDVTGSIVGAVWGCPGYILFWAALLGPLELE